MGGRWKVLDPVGWVSLTGPGSRRPLTPGEHPEPVKGQTWEGSTVLLVSLLNLGPEICKERQQLFRVALL